MPPFEQFVPSRRFQDALAVSPDGSLVAYSANDGGQYNLWTAPVAGGGGEQRTAYEDRSVRSMGWSPDGSRIAFAADQGGDEQYQIHILDVATGAIRQITSAEGRQHALAADPFDPTGRFVAYGANDRDEAVQDVLICELDTGSVRRIPSEPGLLAFPVAFSPDGGRLLVALLRSNTDGDAAVVDLEDPEAELRVLTRHEDDAQHLPEAWLPDGSGFWLLTDAGREFRALATCSLDGTLEVVHTPDHDVDSVRVTSDGATVMWVVNEDTGHTPYIAAGGSLDAPRRVPLGSGVLDAVALAPDGTKAVALAASGVRPTELVTIDLSVGSLTYLTDSRPPALLATDPVPPQLISFPTHDGRDIPAWLYMPAGEGPHPFVLSIHGGPEAQEQARYNYSGLYQHLLANGVGVLAPNVRGSTGYGATYQKLIHRDWGGDELGDFEHAVRYLRTADGVDADRVAVFGGSFGGFAALSCVSRLPGLFAAGVSIVGPSNLVTFAKAVPPTWRPLMAKWVGDPEADAEMLMARSPITYVDDIVAPLFIIQGANDPRVVKAESDQVVEALRSRGVEVRYDVYDDEGHGFTKRSNEIAAIGDVAEFLIEQLG